MGFISKGQLEKYIGKNITVTLFDKSEYTGRLRKTGTEELREENFNLFIRPGYYFVEMDYDVSCIFRSSHITKLKLIK